MGKMLISVEMDEKSALGAIGKIEALAYELQSEVRKLRNSIEAKEKTDSHEESAQGD